MGVRGRVCAQLFCTVQRLCTARGLYRGAARTADVRDLCIRDDSPLAGSHKGPY